MSILYIRHIHKSSPVCTSQKGNKNFEVEVDVQKGPVKA